MLRRTTFAKTLGFCGALGAGAPPAHQMHMKKSEGFCGAYGALSL